MSIPLVTAAANEDRHQLVETLMVAFVADPVGEIRSGDCPVIRPMLRQAR
jgi:hypothetical protein